MNQLYNNQKITKLVLFSTPYKVAISIDFADKGVKNTQHSVDVIYGSPPVANEVVVGDDGVAHDGGVEGVGGAGFSTCTI